MNLDLAGRIALVAAANTELGLAIAAHLARQGAHVAISASREDELDRAVIAIKKDTGRDVLALKADATESAAAERMVQETVDHLGRLDVLVTNANGPSVAQGDLTPGDWEMALRLTLMSAMRLCDAAVPVMKEQGEGSILTVNAVTVRQAQPGAGISHTLRLSIIGLVKALADDLTPFGIRVNGICPGWTRTARVDLLLRDRTQRQVTAPEEEAARIAIDIPVGEMGTPEQYAAAAAFLVSPAASHVSGVCLLVDNGVYRGVM